MQREFSIKIIREGTIERPRFIAGVDVAAGRFLREGCAAVVVLSYPEIDIVEVSTSTGRLTVPYIPGLLSFREIPLIMQAIGKLATKPDPFLVDGQGIAHPRRLGIASHLGLLLDKPIIGCAKSKMVGQHEPVGTERGKRVLLTDKGEIVGSVVRTKTGVKPLYVSIGNYVNLDSSVDWVLKLSGRYRLPEPTRLAHLAAGGILSPSCKASA